MATNTFNAHRSATPDGALVPAEQPCQQPEDQHYRQLEQSYRHSEEYAAMVQRYAVLRQAIEACDQTELVGQ